jgi:hypothetical protein
MKPGRAHGGIVGNKSVLLAVAAIGLAINVWLVRTAEFSDFAGFYAGASLSGSPRLYDRETVAALQSKAAGEDIAMTVRIPAFYALLSPLARLSPAAARRVWMLVMTTAAIGFVLLFPTEHRWPLYVATAWSAPVVRSVLIHQDIPLFLFAAARSFRFWGRGSPFAGGIVLGLLLIKFHLLLFFPIVLAVKREGRFACGLAAAGAALLVASTIAQGGLEWTRDYTRVLLNPATSPKLDLMPNVQSISRTIGIPGWAGLAVLTPFVALAVAVIARRTGLIFGLSAALCAGLLSAPHVYPHDLALAMPFLVPAAFHSSGFGRVAAVLLLIPLTHQVLQLGFGDALAGLLVVAVLSVAWQAHRGRLSLPGNGSAPNIAEPSDSG